MVVEDDSESLLSKNLPSLALIVFLSLIPFLPISGLLFLLRPFEDISFVAKKRSLSLSSSLEADIDEFDSSVEPLH